VLKSERAAAEKALRKDPAYEKATEKASTMEKRAERYLGLAKGLGKRDRQAAAEHSAKRSIEKSASQTAGSIEARYVADKRRLKAVKKLVASDRAILGELQHGEG
jgi:hypothetical protein